MGMKKWNKIISVMLLVAICSTSGITANDGRAEGAVVYITVEAFAKDLAIEIGLKPISGIQESEYVNVLIDQGIIKNGDFSSYTSYLTRGDAAVLLNRADEYLHGDTLDTELIELALNKRVSDIYKMHASKRKDVVKCYLKGIIKGYGNGSYSTNRSMKVKNKITKDGALSCIKLLKDKSNRAKISPDGQLIRTTNLPKNAKLYPYILASYPNEYYESYFAYQTHTITGPDGEVEVLQNLKDYASPADINKLSNNIYPEFKALKEEHINEWVNKAEEHLKLVFDVDYRTIDENWANSVLGTHYSYNTPYDIVPKKNLKKYLTKIKENKTIIECAEVKVDGSSLNYFNNSFYLRCYVKYRILSSKAPSVVDVDTLIDQRPYEGVFYSNGPIDIRGYKLGKWTQGYYDIILDDAYGDGNLGVTGVIFIPERGLY